MAEAYSVFQLPPHDHVFLGGDHDRAERRTWAVIFLSVVMMIAEIIGGTLFGSMALVADGLHMSTHVAALLLAALAYTFARRYVDNRRFSFGTGKFGDLAAYSSAIVLAMIALLIGYEAVSRLISPVAISFNEAIPIAVLGLVVNVASAWLLSGGTITAMIMSMVMATLMPMTMKRGALRWVAAIWKSRFSSTTCRRGFACAPWRERCRGLAISRSRPSGRTAAASCSRSRSKPAICNRRTRFPEPHAFLATARLVREGQSHEHEMEFEEHDHEAGHGAHHRDNNMRAAIVHVMADAAVSVLVIVGLVLARTFGWLWMDPLAGLIGALVIANWSVGLLRDTGGILLDRTPDPRMAEKVRKVIESEGDQVTDLHLWRLGPGHLGAIVSVATSGAREAAHYRRRLARFADLSHVTVEVQHPHSSAAEA